MLWRCSVQCTFKARGGQERWFSGWVGGTQNTNFYSFCQPAELSHDTVPTPSSKTMGAVFTWSNGEPRPLKYQHPGPTRSSRLRSFQERRGRVGGGGGRSRNWLRRVVPSEFRCEVGGESGSLRWSGELFHGTDVVIGIGSLSFEVEDAGRGTLALAYDP